MTNIESDLKGFLFPSGMFLPNWPVADKLRGYEVLNEPDQKAGNNDLNGTLSKCWAHGLSFGQYGEWSRHFP
jgi:hypothetical protein